MFLATNIVILFIFIVAFFMGVNGWRRGTMAELVLACGLLIGFFFSETIARFAVDYIFNGLLYVPNAVVARLQGRPAGPFEVFKFDNLDLVVRQVITLASFLFLVVVAYTISINPKFVKSVGGLETKGPGGVVVRKWSRSYIGAALGALNGILFLAALFRIWTPPDSRGLSWRWDIPAITLSLSGSNENPLAFQWRLLPIIVAIIVFFTLLGFLSKGIPTKDTKRSQFGYILGLGLLVAVVIGIVFTLVR